MSTTTKENLKDFLYEVDEIAINFECVVSNLAYVIEAVEDRNLDNTSSAAFACVFNYLSDQSKRLRSEVDLAFAKLRGEVHD